MYDELNDLVEQVNAQVVELNSAKQARGQARDVLLVADADVSTNASEVEKKLNALKDAVQARLSTLTIE